MSMDDWAENEVELACYRERGGKEDDGKWNYGCACYKSALKAYKSLLEDGHSGMSFSLTANILERLTHHKPLTAIEDTEDSWNYIFDKDDGTKQYQCKRMSSLFKDVYPDGHIEYDDIDRILCYDIDGEYCPYHCGTVSSIVNEMFPMSFPYYPSIKPIKVFIEEFLVDPKNGDYDTQGILYAVIPGKRYDEIVQINRYFKDDGIANKMVEITKEEYDERQTAYVKRVSDAMTKLLENLKGEGNVT